MLSFSRLLGTALVCLCLVAFGPQPVSGKTARDLNCTYAAGDSTLGQGGFLYGIKLWAGVNRDSIAVLKHPAHTNELVVEGILLWWKLISGDEDQFQIALSNGASCSDTIPGGWYGEPDEYIKTGRVPLLFPQAWVLSPDSALAIRERFTQNGLADTLMGMVFGCERVSGGS